MTRFRPRLTFANVVSVLALCVALGGTAIAAGLARDSIKSKQIKAGAVKTEELADSAVTGAKVENGSLTGGDFAAGQVPAGPAGPAGADGTARAYGTVLFSGCAPSPGACTVTDSKGIASVQHNSGGRYCVAATGIDGREVSAVVAMEFSTTSPLENASIATVNNPTGCPNPTDFVVRTQRAGADADNVSFTIIIP